MRGALLQSMRATKNRIVELLRTSKPLTGMQIARKLGVHHVSYSSVIDPALSALEMAGLIAYSAAGKYALTDIARRAGDIYGYSDLKSADSYTF